VIYSMDARPTTGLSNACSPPPAFTWGEAWRIKIGVVARGLAKGGQKVAHLGVEETVIAGLWLPISPPAARADDLAAGTPEWPIELEGLTVPATREERANFDVPSAVTIVDHTAIERQSPRVLPDLLRGETEFSFSSPSRRS
jgi:hypothetical protein